MNERVGRSGDAAWIAWYEAERLYEHYWRGAWDDALELADRIVASASGDEPASVEFDASLVRAWIALGRGNDEEALASVRRAHPFAREAPDPQNLHPALALRARATAELGDAKEAAGYVDELLDDFSQRPTPPGYWVFDVAVASRRLGRGSDALEPIRSAAPATRWLQAADAIVHGDLSGAARLFKAIGAQPEEAYCRLTAATDADSDGDGVGRALDFYRRAGASSYADEAEALLGGRRPA